MKYYGAPYGGCVGTYDLSKLPAFDNPYSALDYASKTWDSNPESSIARLLTVIEVDETASTQRLSFFEFTDANSCHLFSGSKAEIIWSDADMQQWNGNACMMG